MKFSKKIIVLAAAALAVCMTLSSCSGQKEDNGVAYEKDMKISAATDLEGKAVAVQLRSAEDDFIVSNKLTNYPKRYSDMKNAVQDLIDKKVAAVVVDANYAKQLTEGVDGVKTVEKSIGSVDYRFLFKKSDVKIVEKINQQIAALKESEDYQAMIESELVSGKSYTVAKDQEKELKKSLTLIIEPSFRPFAYDNKGEVAGLFVSAADGVAYGCNNKLETMTVDPVVATDDAEEASGENTSFRDNQANTVKGSDRSFCVVTSEAGEDDEVFVTTESFYTSELVMIVREEEKK